MDDDVNLDVLAAPRAVSSFYSEEPMPKTASKSPVPAYSAPDHSVGQESATTFVLRTLRRHPDRSVEPQELTRDVPAGLNPDEIRRAVWDLVGDHQVTLNPDYSMRIGPSAGSESMKAPRRRKAGK